MKTTLLAAMAVLGMALVALAYAAPNHAAAGNGPAYVAGASATVGAAYRLASTDSEGNGGSNPYASPIPARPLPGPAAAT